MNILWNAIVTIFKMIFGIFCIMTIIRGSVDLAKQFDGYSIRLNEKEWQCTEYQEILKRDFYERQDNHDRETVTKELCITFKRKQ